MRILAVDDDPVILEFLGTTLGQGGFGDVTLASSAEHARDFIDAAIEPFDTFLMDIMLPGTSGIEMCREIRQRAVHRATPIIMITASRAYDIMAQAFAAGATDFVSKPFDGLELGTRINLAAMLNESLRRERLSQHRIDALTALTRITFDERFDIARGAAARPFLTLENDLLRRDGAVYAMTLISLRITDALTQFRRMTPAQFREMIEVAGGAIGAAVNPDVTRFAYAGRGAFVAVIYSRDRPDTRAIADAANAALAQDWGATCGTPETVPELVAEKIDDKRLWSGRSAANAMRSFQGRTEIAEPAAPDEIDDLFARLSEKIPDVRT